ncbi:hypothetical protein J437_LFUL007943, partial [Ladona fulva]
MYCLQTCLAESNKLYAVSTSLDPRLKHLHFRDSTALTRAINEVDQLLRSSSEESIQERGISSNYEMNPNDIWSHHDSLMRPHERNEDPLKVWSSIAAVHPNIAKNANKLSKA